MDLSKTFLLFHLKKLFKILSNHSLFRETTKQIQSFKGPSRLRKSTQSPQKESCLQQKVQHWSKWPLSWNVIMHTQPSETNSLWRTVAKDSGKTLWRITWHPDWQTPIFQKQVNRQNMFKVNNNAASIMF